MSKEIEESEVVAGVGIADLPQEVLLHIFSFLFVEDLLSIGAGCREFRAISKDSNLSTNYRRNVNVSFIGSCGAGKSTLVGHLHVLLGEAKLAAEREAIRAAEELGRKDPHARFTFLASRRKLDRQRGVTSDNNYLHVLGSRHPLGFTLIDTAGHRDYFKNTLRGFLQSDMAVWVVDKIPDASEPYQRSDSFFETPLMISGANMRCAIIVVNKMDEHEWRTTKFDEAKLALTQILAKRRIKTENVVIVPVSAADGWNILSRIAVPPGQEKPDDIRVAYQGPTLWEAILQLAPQTPKRPPKKPFRMSVIKMWNTTLAPGQSKRGVILGTVLQGGLKAKQKICLSPAPANWAGSGPNDSLEVSGIGVGKLKRVLAPPGYLVALVLPPGRTIPTHHKRGQDGSGWVAYNPAKEAQYLLETRYMIVQVVLFAGSSVNPALPLAALANGSTPILHFVSGSFTARVVSIHSATNNKTKQVELTPKRAEGAGKMFTITIMSKAPHAIEPYAASPTFGRFFVTDNNALVGAGVVLATVPAQPSHGFLAARAADSSKVTRSPFECEDCPVTAWPAVRARQVVSFYATVPARPPAGHPHCFVCSDCFFARYTNDPTIIDSAYCPP